MRKDRDMAILEVEGLCKRYPAFYLDHVNFGLEKGHVMGFIGRNGAGKTTTLKALMNFVHKDEGAIRFFGMDFERNEQAIKSRIGFVSGGIDFYPRKKLRDITAVTRRFYPSWDEEAYRRNCARFALDEGKTPEQLSAGMKVKYSLALALSHRAELLLLDEPTSGLDPVSRAELLDAFLALAQEGVTILFSTHITSDLDQCADDIAYIRRGKIIACEEMKAFKERYRAVTLPEPVPDGIKALLIGPRLVKNGCTALVLQKDADQFDAHSASLEDIMVHFEREDEK